MNRRNKGKYITIFAAAFLAAAFIFRPEIYTALWDKISGAVIPIFLGIILAAAIYPAADKTEKLLLKYSVRPAAARYLSVSVIYLAIAGAVIAVIWIVIPRLIDSAALFIGSLDGYYSDFLARYRIMSDSDPLGLFSFVEKLISGLSEKLPYLFEKTFTATAGIIRSMGNFILGLVLSIYILAGREQLTDFIKGAAQSFMSEKNYRRTAVVMKTLSGSLVNFISGQITEAVVLGTLCFAGMVIFDFEYPLLISTMIGVTALIPVVGAFAGAVPSVLVLFLVKPSSALWFVLFIIILQQLENNLIYPKIVGKSVGLPPILILIAIIVGAELGGAGGIMLAIPLLSAFYILAGSCIMRERDR